MLTIYLLKDFKGPKNHKIIGTICTSLFDLCYIVPVVLGIMGVI